jgi:cytochrome c553
VCAGSTSSPIGDPNSTCDATGCWQEKEVPVNQGIFLHDTAPGGTSQTVARTGARFDEFLFWNYSGKVPCTGGGHSEEGAEDDGELVRWRSSAFVAVSGEATAFKAVASGGQQGACGSCHSGDKTGSAPPTPSHGRLIGIYFNRQPVKDIFTVLDTRTDGQALDPEAPVGSTITELGIEREGLRGNWIAVSAKMGVVGGSEEDGMAGIYLTNIRK